MQEKFIRRMRHRKRISSDELTKLVRALDTGTVKEQCHALMALCPCRCITYDIEMWRKVFHLAKESNDSEVRHQAGHAVDTLKKSALRNLRSWELILQLKEDKEDLSQLTGNLFSDERPKMGAYKMLRYQRKRVIADVLRGMLPSQPKYT